MTLAARTWTTAMITRLTDRACAHARDGSSRMGEILLVEIAGLQERVAAAPAMSVELPAAEVENGHAAHSTDLTASVTWASPVFRQSGTFDPSAGSKRDRMLASADTCRRLGAEEAATAYGRAAEQACRASPAEAPTRTPIAAPFVAGPQLALFA